MNINKIIIIFLLLIVYGDTFAQNIAIKGSIKNTEGQPIVAVVVSLTKTDSTVISYAITNNDGI